MDHQWTVDILPFCGKRVGKYLVMKLLGRDSPSLVVPPSLRRTTCLWMAIGPQSLGRLTGTKRASGQAISYRIAHFIQFRDEKVIDYVSIIDSFDAVEQLLGYNLDAYDGYRVEGNVVTV